MMTAVSFLRTHALWACAVLLFALPAFASGMYLSPIGSVEGAYVGIGNNTAAQGTFRDLPAGVVSVGNVNMNVANTRFENILPNTAVNYPIQGTGIHFVGFSQMASALSVAGQTATVRPVFNACTTAIDVRSAGVQIRESTAENCRYGFIVQQVSNAPIDIQGNLVHSFTRAGIDLRHNDGALSLRVARNDLRLAAGAKGTAISISEAGTRAANRTANILPQTNEKAVRGILLKTLSDGEIELNAEAEALLADVAEQCPLSGGKVVHLARSLYRLVNTEAEFGGNCLGGVALVGQQTTNALSEQPLVERKAGKLTLENTLEAYPNPVKNQLTIETQTNSKGWLQLVGSLGQIVWEHSVPTGHSVVNMSVSNFPNGVYYLRLASEDGQFATQKVIVTQ